jgi:hypothetical protein
MIARIEGRRLVRATRLVVLLLALCFAGQVAQAATVVVGTCMSGTRYGTIMEAVAATSSGSTIYVCPGTYAEQVTITTSKLTLEGVQSGASDAAVIVPPASGLVANAADILGNPVAAQIFVQGAVGVTISHLTVDGSANELSGCAINLEGIYFQNSSGTITDNAVRNQMLPPDLGCQAGLAINVESTVGTPAVTISYNSVRNYQKNGITADGNGNGSGPNVTVMGNTVIGIGATPSIAQNGIQIGLGATGKVESNYVVDDIYTGSDAASSGILIYASGSLTVLTNTVESTQLAIAAATDPVYGPADGTTVTSNHIGGTQNFDAIDLCSNNNTAESNIIYGSSQSGVHVDDTCPGPGSSPSGMGNSIEKNTINEACAGILEGPNATSNTVTSNTFLNVTTTMLTGADTCTPPAAAAAVALNRSAKTRSLRPSPYKFNVR